jgi:YegS/Rv2252/BmrU family lipid kinase
VAPQFIAQLRDLTEGRGTHAAILILFASSDGILGIVSASSAIVYRRAILIYNPRAGRFVRGGAALLDEAYAALLSNGLAVELRPTTGPRAATGMALRAIEEGADLVIAAGGDGTVNEVVEGLAGSAVPLAVLPAGTANVLAMETGMGSDVVKAASRLSDCVPCRISVGRITAAEQNTRHFLLMAGAGLDAHIVYHLDAALKSRTGKFAYWVGGMKVIGRELPEFLVSANGDSYSCSFALVSKVRNYGGDFQIACDANLLDDCFEVVLFQGSTSLRYLKYLAGVAVRRVAGMRGVTVLRATRVELSCPEDARIYVQIDGEFAGRLPATVEVAPDALTLLLPQAYISGRRRVA